MSSCDQESANLFASHFSSVYTTGKTVVAFNYSKIPTFDLLNNTYLNVDDVYQCLSALHGVWSVGPDDLCGDFLFQLGYVIAYPLWLLFRRSLNEGIFPIMLKISSITPIPKSGSHSIIYNYGLISIQSHITKLFEILNSIQPPVNKIFMEEQHGFRPGRSTLTCNLVFNNFIHE